MVFAPGLLALVALAGTTGLGLFVTPRIPNALAPKGVASLSCVTGVTAVFFWVWAVHHTLTTPDFDAGCVSFALALAPSLYGLCSGATFGNKTYAVLAFLGFGAVSANYMLAVVVFGDALGRVFLLYVCVGVAFWTACAALAIYFTSRQTSDQYEAVPL
ncbi:hypothetical protein M885DRAFT_505589 [Pelagophyceae sp. CCMP2097]|nr:hypothetical protein M885DRAFT_505589 [Pelagophyceae sp. CCMP2097]|mmetsp:Transcript_6137/g.19673  ORF Transcript_6137/g.19673 Transcript_6137/m.19673 type:complete len:159 (+) Transcript_6137:98-574(+)|eukprot:CAMPEP_0184103508 /NCGR_PEP_ID=MMETSP0974-20121125/13889_1 /TAXON_ID=483370 /ORGANISM="non described non described, Strain CCMP2097" /LENGTH=158 /DNA_ID=CAMNT_0026406479 /DNA_START=27 /DNA_END=503 /DNA_ORIENTATION=+